MTTGTVSSRKGIDVVTRVQFNFVTEWGAHCESVLYQPPLFHASRDRVEQRGRWPSKVVYCVRIRSRKPHGFGPFSWTIVSPDASVRA